MADKNITIGIKTTGADASAKEIRKVDKATESLGESAGKQAARGLENMSDKARVSEFAHYDLDKALRETNNSMGTFTAGQTQVQKSSRNSAQALYLFSQGFEDASYGIRGVLNNIPGLVIAMGGTAGLAGAISLAAVGLSQIIPLFTKTEEKASDVAERVKEVSEKIGQLEVDRFVQVGEKIDAAREKVDAVKQSFDDTRAAEQNFATSALDNAGKLTEAQRNIAESLGKQVDSYKELQSIAAAEEEKRRLAAEQAVEAERQKIAAAKEAATLAADFFAEQQARSASEQGNLVRLRGELALLREQRDELERAANRKINPGGFIENLIRGVPEQAADVSLQRSERSQARKQLEDPAFKAELEGTSKRVDELEQLVLTLTKDGGILQKAENAFLTAQTQLTDLSPAVGVNISRIEQTLAADNLLARSQNIAATQEQQAKDLSENLSKITSSTDAARSVTTGLGSLAADGLIAANESEQLIRQSVQLIGQLQSGQATAGANTESVIRSLNMLIERDRQLYPRLVAAEKAISDLQKTQ